MNLHHSIYETLVTKTLPPRPESATQDAIDEVLRGAGFLTIKEHTLGPKDRIDFFVEGMIGIEVKTRGLPRSILRQLLRYAGHEAVESLIQVMSRAMALPQKINGKTVSIVSIGESWL